MVAGLAEMQVSPASMLQKTLMASLGLPPSGSIQYSPGKGGGFDGSQTDRTVQRQTGRK